MKQLKDYLYYETALGKLYCGDCLEILPLLNDKVDLVLTDMPYGITNCEWDNVPDLKKLWNILKKISKYNTVYVFTASQPFTTDLINSNRKWFKYEWIWDKCQPTNFFLVKKQPMKVHENILIFYNKFNIYNSINENKTINRFGNDSPSKSECYGSKGINYKINVGYPRTIIKFRKYNNLDKKGNLHPTQKPDELFEYLLITYSNRNQLILDPFLGSGTTAVACEKLNRRWIGIEISEKYCSIAKKRIEAEASQIKMVLV